MYSRPPSPVVRLLEGRSRQSSPNRSRKKQPIPRSSMRFAAGVSATLAALVILLLWQGGAAQQTSTASTASGSGSGSASDIDSFVQIIDGQFVVNCKAFYVSGWNQWEAVEAAAGALELFGASLPDNSTGPALVRQLLDRAAANGFNVVRYWAHAVTPQYALQVSPGQYSEAMWRGLDYLLDEARQRGVRVLLSLTDNWQQSGGADEMVRWAGQGLTHEDFFTDTRVKALYKSHVEAVLGRVNAINGRQYSLDPAIFGWDLINEPRCYQCGTALQLWVQEMAAFVKSLDTNHLLTVGEEGFYPAGIPQAAANPQGVGSWAEDEGQSFIADHSSPNIDFMAIHLWVNNWEDKTPEFVQRWIRQHVADAQAAGKPLLLEEFGVWGGNQEEREQYYRLILDAVQQNAKAGGPLKGALFWTWYAEGQRAPAEEGGNAGGLFGVFEGEGQTWSTLQSFAGAMKALTGAPAAACPSTARTFAASKVPPPPDCRSTWVGGQRGTGFEGPGCSTDINECARGTANCAQDAACRNSNGGFTCACFAGYSGDGYKSCTPDSAALVAAQDRYDTDGPGKVACQEGADVAYPEGTPGFQYDVTGALARMAGSGDKGQYGSRTSAAPLSCMLACDAAPGCDSFAYNPLQQKCFLKSGATRETCRKPPTTCVSARGKTYNCGAWQTYFKTSAGPTAPAAAGRAQGASPASPAAAGGRPPPASPSVALLPDQEQASVQLVESFQG